MAYIFRPPTRSVKYSTGRLFSRMPRVEGISLLKTGGTWRQVSDPREEEIRSADSALLGGRLHTVSDAVAAELVTAGYDDCLEPADVTAPVIQGVGLDAYSQRVHVGVYAVETGLTVTALYGPTSALGSAAAIAEADDGWYLDSVEGLAPSTLYYVRVKVEDPSGNASYWPPLDQPPLTATTLSYVDSALSVFSDGFESGTLASWPTVTGAASASTSAAYTGSYGVRCAPSASTGTVATSTTKWPQIFMYGLASFRFRLVTLPSSGSADIATLRNTYGSGHADLFVHSSGTFWFDLVGGSSEIDTGVPAVAGVWHTAQIKTFYGDSTWAASLLLDGVEHTIIQMGSVPSFVRSFHLGTASTKTYTLDVDDVRVLVGSHDPGWGVV